MCKYRFQYQKRVQGLCQRLWHEYAGGKQTFAELSDTNTGSIGKWLYEFGFNGVHGCVGGCKYGRTYCCYCSKLSDTYEESRVWVRKKLDAVEVTIPDDLTPQPTLVFLDTTFWGRTYDICVFRSWTLKRNNYQEPPLLAK